MASTIGRAVTPACLLLLLLLLAACGSDAGPAAPADPDPVVPGQPAPTDTHPGLECGLPEHPCSLASVSVQVLERSDALRQEAAGRWTGAAPAATVAAWLRSQVDVAEVQSDTRAVRFRVAGGRGVWIVAGSVFAPTGPRGAPAAPRRAVAALRPVVNPGSPEKSALVLSPYLWQFGEFDDGAAVAGILAGTRGYQGRVRFEANAQMTDAAVGIASFKGWDAHDVIHLTGHGRRLCDGATCRGALFAGLLDNLLPSGPGTKAGKLRTITEPGVEIAMSTTTGREHVVLVADFFRNQYPSGLDDTVVFINGCQTQGPGSGDLVDAIRGSTSVVFGWTESVYSGEATAAAVALYGHLSGRGYPARIAHAKLEGLATGTPVEDAAAPVLQISGRVAGGDLRIREVVTVLHPFTGQPLVPSDLVAIDGTARDGIPDAAPFRVRIDGVTPEIVGAMSVRVRVDGVATDALPVASGVADAEDRWTLQGTVPLPYDVVEDRPVAYRGTVTLHGGGESEESTGAVLTGATPLMGFEWMLEATHTSFWVGVPHTPYTATTTLTLHFADGQAPSEPNPTYVVTGGTVTWDYNHTYFNCTFSAPVLTFDVDEAVSTGSRLRFDTTVEPRLYSGYIYTRGPTVTVSEQCGEGASTRSQVAQNIWLDQQAGGLPVMGDSLITGTHRTGTGSFVIESRYTIRRVR